jgi:putative peptide zinc metalloprotease protein
VTQSGVLDRPPETAAALPRLAPGTELLGEYRDSAYEDPRFIIRRADGQVMQLPRLLYRVAASLDGREAEQVAAELGVELGRDLTPEQVTFLVEDRLRPVGILAADDTDPSDAEAGAGSPPVPVRSDPLLALRYRAGVVPASVAWRIGGFFRPLFARPVWVSFVAAFLAADVWIIAQGDVLGRLAAGVVDVALRPGLVLAILGLTVVFTAFHECGHVTACRYGGARPGDLGVGLYIVWPAFYSTVTDSYRLDRVGRLRTDLGGIYFNTIAMLTLALVHLWTGEPWLLIGLVSMHVQTLWQFLPNLRLDGYYILADLVGVPELFGFVRPALLSLLPGRPPHPALSRLKPRARRVILWWVALIVPTLAVWLVVFLLAAPRLLPAAWNASLEYIQRLDAAARGGDVMVTTLGVLQLFLLALPWIGLALILWSLIGLVARRPSLRRAGRLGAVRWPAARRVVAVAGVGALGGLLVLRVARVAWSHPATAGELRLVDSAWAALQGLPGPSGGSEDWFLRAQIVVHARLTGAFQRHDTIVAGGRELVVLAAGVLVAVLLVFVLTRGLSWLAVALPLLVVLVTGPAVTVLATVGSGIVGTAWAAVGALLLTSVRRPAAAGLGVAAIAVGVATEPLIAVPVAVGTGMVLGRNIRTSRPPARHAAGPRHARRTPEPEDPSRWLGALLVVPVAGLTAGLAGGSAEFPVDGSERSLLLLLAALVVGAGLFVRRLRLPAAVACSVTLLAAVPWPGAGRALPMSLVAVALVGTLLIAASTSGEPGTRPHPLLRVALALPVAVLVVTGALFLPVAGRTPPHQELATWIEEAPPGDPVVVPAGLWGDLLRDGVPPDRLVLADPASAGARGWTVSVGPSPAGPPPVAVFGSGPTAVTVHPPAGERKAGEP